MIGRLKTIFLPVLAGLFLSLLFGAHFSNNAYAQSQTLGSITICKVITDPSGNITDGSSMPGVSFVIPGITPAQTSEAPATGQIPDSPFTTPLTANADLIGGDGINDSQCTTYSNLTIGSYYYGQETISPAANWKAPLYNDQYAINVFTLGDFFTYDSNLFDGDPANDASRNLNADGHIILTNARPDRTLVVLNQLQSGPSTGGGPNIGGGPSTGGNISTPQCPTGVPQKIDQVWFSNDLPGEVTVNWANKGDAWGFHIAYGPSQNSLIWGVDVPDPNANSFTLKGLQGGNLWVAVTAKSSQDCGGPTTDPKQVDGGVGAQVLGASTLASTGSLDSMVLLLSGAALISAGLWNAQNALKKGKKA
ncbi:hypothetical protein A2870_00200 [Candidatus Curtissbacteria bacterium RIFCSPHIGHO2_01_FULL_41_11]|uniref:Uncharacterized protein n=1 Tax=Candidatus Curtissbacteria bacterium RIFCSPHIGHO2_01_FULL_41_11 TaxID=1797711 RepID=A0A1F5G5A2_9BACT|nr:MAG: hypothetical protein A2870_00200 [Candidatus Curtissbacteria bacterium RIFCSPHIGHO2_01_FULL_41_11]